MLICCCKNLLRPYCFVVMIITIIFHSSEFFVLDFLNGKLIFTIPLGTCHVIAVYSALQSIPGLIKKKENPLFIFLFFAVFGFIPLVVDLVLVIAGNQKIYMFDTSFIESAYGANAVKPIICLIVTLAILIKCYMIEVVFLYCGALVEANSTSAEFTRQLLAHLFMLEWCGQSLAYRGVHVDIE